MAAPVFVGVSPGVGVDDETSTITVAAPSGVQSGDHQLAFVAVFDDGAEVLAPSGWTAVGSQTNTSSGTPFVLWCFRSTTVTTSQGFDKGTDAPAVATRIAYRGGGGFASFAGTSNSGTSSHSLASVTTTAADSVVIGVLAEGTTSSSINHTIPSGWNGFERLDYASSSSIGRVGMLAVYDTVKAAPGSQAGSIGGATSGHSATLTVVLTSGGAPPPDTGPILDEDDELNWTVPSVPGAYTIRYEVVADQGTFSDDVVVTVSPVPTGAQTLYPDPIASRLVVGEPTVSVEPPEGAPLTLLGGNTVLGESFYLGYGPNVGPGPQTISPFGIPSRAIVGDVKATVDPVPVPIEVSPDSIPPRLSMGAVSVTIGAAPPDQPITDLTLSLFAIDPDTGYGIPLPDFAKLELSPLRNSGGSLTVDYPSTGVNFDVLRDAITSGRDVEVEVWVSGTATGARRGYLQEAAGDDVAEGGVWTFGGGFLGLRMDEAWIEPQDQGPLVPDDDDNPDNDKHANEKRELIFNQASAGTVMATAMQQAYARAALEDIVYDFTATHDSDGNPWPQVISTKFSPGASYKQLLDRLVTLGLAEWDVLWDGAHRVLRMWVPEGRGDDLSDDAIPVVLRHGQNILDAPRKWSVREAGTTVMVAGSDGLYDDATDATALARRGRRIERFVSANNLADDEAVTAYAFNQLPLITAGLHEVTHGIGFLPGSPRPIVTYDVGDWVLSESGATQERLRVVQWTLTVDDKQSMSGTVTLNDTQTDWLVRLKAQLEAITSGETVVGTSEPSSGSLSDITPPAAPEGLVASSIAYSDPAHTNPLASVTVGWLPVVTNADGSNYPEVQAARYILLQMEELEQHPPDPDEDPVEAGMIDQDTWTWKECPRVVTDYAPVLRAAWAADGSPAGVETWLTEYVAEFSATPTATDDVAGYKVRYAYIGLAQVGGLPSSDPFPESDRFYYEATPSNGITGTSYTFGGVEGGANIRIEVQAFDRSGNHGPWASIGHDTSADDTPPPRTAPPGLSVWFRTLDISWDGLGLLGEPMPPDFDHVEVWISQSADFSTASSTAELATAFDPTVTTPQHVANLYAAGTWNQPDLPHGVGWYAALRAVDRARNVSAMSAQSGPATAEQLFPDDLRDQIINDSSMIAAQTIGTLHVVDGAIINAKIADLAVNDAKIESLNVGKLRSGTMIAQVTISGKFRTHESDAANRVEFDAAGIRLYQGSNVVGAWNVADASMLVTGTYQSALVGERINIFPDGTLRFYPQSGTNYSQMSTVGAEVIWRGPVNSDGRSGRLNVNALGVGLNYSAESEIPNNLRSEVVVLDRRTRTTAPLIQLEVNGRLATHDGTKRRVQFTQTSPSGTTMPYSYVSYGTSSQGFQSGGFYGQQAGIKFESGMVLITEDELNNWGRLKARELYADNIAYASSSEVKTEIADIQATLDPLETVRRAPSKTWSYEWDPDARTKFGPVAEDLPPALLMTTKTPDGRTVAAVSLNDQIGLLWGAVRQLISQIDDLSTKTKWEK